MKAIVVKVDLVIQVCKHDSVVIRRRNLASKNIESIGRAGNGCGPGNRKEI